MNPRVLAASTLIGLMSIPMLASKETSRPLPAATILCYHIVESPQDPRMEISRETFRQHMRYLAMTGYNVIPLRHLYEYVSGKRASLPRNAVVVTIDDGWRSTYTEVFPEMKNRRFPFTVFIYPKIIGQTAFALSWKQIREMSEAGVDIQSHTLSHPYLTKRRHSSLSERDYTAWLEHELRESKKTIERQTGRNVSFLAYPYGDYDGRVAATVASSGYDAALTCDFGRVMRGSDPLRLKRIVIDKRMDFATFRHYLGVGTMRIEEIAPAPNQVTEPEQPIVVSARIPNHESLDPKSVGMALLGAGSPIPYAYDAREGSISVVVNDALDALKGTYQRALVWANDRKTGKRVEASWTFRIPPAEAPCGAASPAPATSPCPPENGTPAAGGGGGGSGTAIGVHGVLRQKSERGRSK